MTSARRITLPALIDAHVHFREPGLTHKATMASESRAAFAGGVHTVCEMPNTIPPTVTVAALADKVRRAEDVPNVDIRFFFGATQAAHIVTLKELFTGDAADLVRLRKRCCGVKLYLDHSTGDQGIDASLLDEAFTAVAELNIVAVCHCEDPATNAAATAKEVRPGADVAVHALARPPESEAIAVERAIGLCRTHGTRLHIAHLSTKEALDLVRAAKREGLPVSCEVAPHHLFLTVDDFAVLGTLAKMNPPLRTREHQEALWEGIADGTVDCIATDHAPHTLAEKQAGEPLQAPSGVPGVETMLPLLLTVAADAWPHPSSRRPASARLTHGDIERLCFTAPNAIFGLGKDPDADRITIEPDAGWTIHADALHSACGWTPYENWQILGKVV